MFLLILGAIATTAAGDPTREVPDDPKPIVAKPPMVPPKPSPEKQIAEVNRHLRRATASVVEIKRLLKCDCKPAQRVLAARSEVHHVAQKTGKK